MISANMASNSPDLPGRFRPPLPHEQGQGQLPLEPQLLLERGAADAPLPALQGQGRQDAAGRDGRDVPRGAQDRLRRCQGRARAQGGRGLAQGQEDGGGLRRGPLEPLE